MSLLAIAELLAGEALITPGGPVDRLTAISDEPVLWSQVSITTVTVHAAPLPAEVPAPV